jgi:hypothetical protein
VRVHESIEAGVAPGGQVIVVFDLDGNEISRARTTAKFGLFSTAQRAELVGFVNAGRGRVAVYDGDNGELRLAIGVDA